MPETLTAEQKTMLLDYLKQNIGHARYWVEVCYEDDCPAFRETAMGYLIEAIRVCKELKGSDEMLDLLGNAVGALKIGKIREANDALDQVNTMVEVMLYVGNY